ncbi:unnamed protein product [Adineta steineri]|uniref:Uncharacterized protein n=1 Tax=Adineta steineri TaxID=433720 RepID=A0A818GR15_9BILA|nr:unnamed protein product [Adineta steineri]CAF3494411.1 unnamed protein product [Adineta steineri]
MSDETTKADVNLVRLPSIDEQHDRQVILNASPSIISFETVNLPKSILDILDDLYSNRSHQRCIHISYFTLLSMTLTVIFWISYWLTYNRCQNLKDPQPNSFLCDLVLIFEVLTFTLISITPVLFIFMIHSWIIYSCYNPFDSIRDNFIGFKIEGEQWKQQLDYYYQRKKTRYLNCFRCKQRKELNDRGHGYIILSTHGIVIDELIMLNDQKNIIDKGILLDNGKILKLTFKRTCKRPWKTYIEIYLTDDLINRRTMEELMESLKIQINIDAILPPCF